MLKLPDLAALDFGQGAADHEESLANYFYQNQAFDRACEPGICLVLGEKGAGKSAIFLMMKDRSQDIPELANPNFFVATQANLREHFHLLRSKLTNQVSFVTLWKFYFASISALTLVESCSGEDAAFLQKFVQHWELNPHKFPTFLGATLRFPAKFAELEVKRGAPTPPNPLQLQEVFSIVNRILSRSQESKTQTLWIALDELDKVALDGNGTKNQTTDALTALMQTHSELFPLGRIRFKFFIRSDIYEALTYVDKDHFSNAILRLKWEPEDLAIMLALRINASSGAVGSTPKLAEAHEVIENVFDWPKTIGSFSQLLNELRDGRGNVTPRDLLNFAINSRDNQKRFNQFGTNRPLKGIISAAAIEAGLKEASAAKLNDFLTTFPEIHKRFLNLQGHGSPRLSRTQLQKLLNLPDELDFNLAIEEFWRIGAIAKQDDRPVHLTDGFVIPPIYRRALNMAAA